MSTKFTDLRAHRDVLFTFLKQAGVKKDGVRWTRPLSASSLAKAGLCSVLDPCL